jgi:SAM-dependent methyltransferase
VPSGGSQGSYDPIPMSTSGFRGGLTRHLVGSGIEVGPGHVPLVESNPWLTVRYLDRWEPDRNAELFPELEGATFPEPDLVVDLNRDALGPLPSMSEDFIVCSHVLEHLANPLRAIDDFHRVLRPGGTLLILLPDRRRTFDKDRFPTALEHIVADFEAGEVEVDDEHIMEFIANTGTDPEVQAIATDSRQRAALLAAHRERSIHVHCWTLEEFVPVIGYSIEALHNQWLFVDGFLTDEQGAESIEFGLVLRRSPIDLPPADLAKLFAESFGQWHANRQRALDRPQAADEQVAQLRAVIGDLETRLAAEDGSAARAEAAEAALTALDRDMQALLSTRTMRYTSGLRKLYGRLRKT